MKVAYDPIPIGLKVSNTVSNFVMGGCDGNQRRDFSATASISVSPQTGHEYVPYSEHRLIIKETSGLWGNIKRSGIIKMTPLVNESERTYNFLGAVRHHVTDQSLVHDSRQSSRVNGICTNCTVRERVYAHAKAEGSYVQQGDFAYWRWFNPHLEIFGQSSEFDESEIARASSEAYAELFQQYNLGEELYELRETLTTLADLVHRGYLLLFRHYTAYKKLVDSSNVQGAANAWLEFRYAIMPIIFSIQDIQKLASSKGKYATVRKTVLPHQSFDEPPSAQSHFYREVRDRSKVRITTKGLWRTELERKLDQVNLNILTTAATVPPWMFVIRWFININSWIDAQVKSLTTSAIQYTGCISRRTQREERLFLRYFGDSTTVIYDNGDSGPCGPGYYGPYGPHRLGGKYETNVLLREKIVDSYTRTIYTPQDTELVWSVRLNWQRLLDALALSSRNLSKLLRSL